MGIGLRGFSAEPTRGGVTGGELVVSRHPIVQHQIAALRDVRTPPAEFRRLVRTLAVLLAQEATADLPTERGRSDDAARPGGHADAGRHRRDRADPPGRAGDGRRGPRPDPRGRGLAHRPLSRRARRCGRPSITTSSRARPRITLALVVDPMLATGGSAVRACEILKAAGVPRLKLLALIAAPEGIARMTEAMPDVPIHVGAIDDRLERGRLHLSRPGRRRRPPVRDHRRS